jgi:hypothetical protein
MCAPLLPLSREALAWHSLGTVSCSAVVCPIQSATRTVPKLDFFTGQSSASLLRYADKAHRGSAARMVMIETGDRA